MRVLIAGKPVDGLTAKQEKDLQLSRQEESLQGSVLSADDASVAYTRRVKWLFGGFGTFVLVLILGISLAADDVDRWLVIPVTIAFGGLVAAFFFLMARRQIRGWKRTLDQRLASLPPAGSAIGLDANGLSVAGQAFPWPALSIDQVEIARYSTAGDSITTVYAIERLSLATPTGIVVLDKEMIRNGLPIVDNVWRRLHAAR